MVGAGAVAVDAVGEVDADGVVDVIAGWLMSLLVLLLSMLLVKFLKWWWWWW